jgi:hypothetical protein
LVAQIEKIRGALKGKFYAAATFRGPERPIAQYVMVRKSMKFPVGIELKSRRARIGDIWAFNWIITANLLHLREMGVYHTATAA